MLDLNVEALTFSSFLSFFFKYLFVQQQLNLNWFCIAAQGLSIFSNGVKSPSNSSNSSQFTIKFSQKIKFSFCILDLKVSQKPVEPILTNLLFPPAYFLPIFFLINSHHKVSLPTGFPTQSLISVQLFLFHVRKRVFVSLGI